MTKNELNVSRLQYEHPVCLFVPVDAADLLCASTSGTTEDYNDLENFVW